jgi:hypothetical protein
MSQEDLDRMKQMVNNTVAWTQEQLVLAEDAFNSGTQKAATSVREGLSYALNQADAVRAQVEVRIY